MSDIKAYAVVYGFDRFDYVEQCHKVYKTVGAARAVARRMRQERTYRGRENKSVCPYVFVKIIELSGDNKEVPV